MEKTNDIQLQQLTPADAALLSKVAKEAYSDHYLHYWYDGGAWYIDKSFAVKNLAAEIADENALLFLVYYSNATVGFIKLNIDAAFENWNKDEALELERIYLTKAASGKGIGSYLIHFTIEFAQQRNKKIVWLKVMDTSLAPISFYQKHGFEICGSLHLDFPQMKEELRGMFIMKKNL